MGVGGRLTHRQQCANLTEQVKADPRQHSVSRLVEKCRALLGIFICQEVAPVLGKRNGVPVDWDTIPLVREDARVLPLAAGLDLLFIVKMRLSSGIKEDQLCGSVTLAISGTEKNVVLPIPAIKLPRSLEQLEELANNILFRRICNDTYHREGS